MNQHRCGSVAIIGRPNVGKSTLLNRFLGQKIAIVSPKPETTRQRLLGILTLPQAQILFIDTPGIYRGPKTLLAKHQVLQAREALQEADLLLLLTEATAGVTEEDRQIVQLLPKKGTGYFSQPKKGTGTFFQEWAPREKGASPREPVPVFLAINKVDRVEKGLVLPQIDQASKLYPFQEIFPISATKGDNVEGLLKAMVTALPEGPALYPADQVTDRSLRQMAQELIREKVLLFTHEEIPYAVAVLIDEWRPGRASGEGPQKQLYIRSTLFVERDSQKAILIGKGGSLLKRIGQAARAEMEPLTEAGVYLDLWVKVKPNWRKDPAFLKQLGF